MTWQNKLFNLCITTSHGLTFHPDEASLKFTRFLLMFSLVYLAMGLCLLVKPQSTECALILPIMLLGLGWCMGELFGLLDLYMHGRCPLCDREAPSAGIPWHSRYRLMNYFMFFTAICLASGVLSAGPHTNEMSCISTALGLFLPVPLLLTCRASGLIASLQKEIDTALKADLKNEDLDNLSTDQLEHASELAAMIMQHRNRQVINQELNTRLRRQHQEE